MSCSCGEGGRSLFLEENSFNLRFIIHNLDQKTEASQQYIHCDNVFFSFRILCASPKAVVGQTELV